MRNRFDEQLESLNNSLIRMGALCESAIANATKALLEGDRTLAGRAIEADSEIDQAEREVESLCLKPVSYTHLDVYQRQQALSGVRNFFMMVPPKSASLFGDIVAFFSREYNRSRA